VPATVTPAAQSSLQRDWWLRALMVLSSPRAVFEAMRDPSRKAAEAREEPVLAIIFLAGMASVLSFSTTTREFLDDPAVDGALIPILVFLGGAMYAFAGYWIAGLALMMGVRGAKGEVTYKHARHLLAYALVPLAASLVVVWPIRLVAYGWSNFRTGGHDDAGSGYWIFTGLAIAFVAWSLVVLVVGIRVRFEWTVVRSIGALTLTVLALLGIAVLGIAVGGL
jgi:hypothetical protein